MTKSSKKTKKSASLNSLASLASSAEAKQLHPWNLKAEMDALLRKKRAIDQNLALVETKIYGLESSYFSELQKYGNLVQGLRFPDAVSPAATPAEPAENNDGDDGNVAMDGMSSADVTPAEPALVLSDADRIFSQSSLTHPAALAVADRIKSAVQSAQTSALASRAPSPAYFKTPVIVSTSNLLAMPKAIRAPKEKEAQKIDFISHTKKYSSLRLNLLNAQKAIRNAMKRDVSYFITNIYINQSILH